jgi:eukaryotic-like serine/threonine-protein kinase
MPFPTSEFVRQGRFRNVRVIGQGSFGKVYYAEENVGRPVAVKEIIPGNPYVEDARAKFQKEINLLARLQHPNIIAV